MPEMIWVLSLAREGWAGVSVESASPSSHVLSLWSSLCCSRYSYMTPNHHSPAIVDYTTIYTTCSPFPCLLVDSQTKRHSDRTSSNFGVSVDASRGIGSSPQPEQTHARRRNVSLESPDIGSLGARAARPSRQYSAVAWTLRSRTHRPVGECQPRRACRFEDFQEFDGEIRANVVVMVGHVLPLTVCGSWARLAHDESGTNGRGGNGR